MIYAWEVWGACNHVFHEHCIQKWLDQQKAKYRPRPPDMAEDEEEDPENPYDDPSLENGTCPMDRRPWVTKCVIKPDA